MKSTTFVFGLLAMFASLVAGLYASPFPVNGALYIPISSMDSLNNPNATKVIVTVLDNSLAIGTLADVFVEKNHIPGDVAFAWQNDALLNGSVSTLAVWDSYVFGITIYPMGGGFTTTSADDAGWASYLYAPMGQSDSQNFLTTYHSDTEGDLALLYHIPDATSTFAAFALGLATLGVVRQRSMLVS